MPTELQALLIRRECNSVSHIVCRSTSQCGLIATGYLYISWICENLTLKLRVFFMFQLWLKTTIFFFFCPLLLSDVTKKIKKHETEKVAADYFPRLSCCAKCHTPFTAKEIALAIPKRSRLDRHQPDYKLPTRSFMGRKTRIQGFK